MRWPHITIVTDRTAEFTARLDSGRARARREIQSYI